MEIEAKAGDLIAMAFGDGAVLGLIIGASLVGVFIILYGMMRKQSLRRYYMMVSEKDDLMGTIGSLDDMANKLAVRTNTMYFKWLSNELNDLINTLKRRDLR